MSRLTGPKAAFPHHWPVHHAGTHIPAAPVRAGERDAEALQTAAPPAELTDAHAGAGVTGYAGLGADDGELTASPWIGLHYRTENG
jgi:hypothetical protein